MAMMPVEPDATETYVNTTMPNEKENAHIKREYEHLTTISFPLAGSRLMRLLFASCISFWLLISNNGYSAVPLVEAGEWVGTDWDIWWTKQKLVIADKGNDTGKLPLEGYRNSTFSKNENWTLLNKSCDGKTDNLIKLSDNDAKIQVQNLNNRLTIDISINETIVAQTLMARPMTLCALMVREADALPGPEMIIIWKIDEKTSGLTIFRIPETIKAN